MLRGSACHRRGGVADRARTHVPGTGRRVRGGDDGGQRGCAARASRLAAGLLNTAQWLGAALGLAIFSAIATSRTSHLLATHATRPAALTSGFHIALLACSIFLFGAAVIATRATNTPGRTGREHC